MKPPPPKTKLILTLLPFPALFRSPRFCPKNPFDYFFLLAILAWFHKNFEFGLYGCLYRAIKHFTWPSISTRGKLNSRELPFSALTQPTKCSAGLSIAELTASGSIRCKSLP
jgi:hypothetical protein